MNRSRNPQPRPLRDNNNPRKLNNRRYTDRFAAPSRSSNVPTIQQIVPGAAVSIILKEDQPTGREIQGVVQDLLTRGNHPRGIKVRLQDGRVGRVQRMAGQQAPAGTPWPVTDTIQTGGSSRSDADCLSGPPPRSLADFLTEPKSDEDSNPANL